MFSQPGTIISNNTTGIRNPEIHAPLFPARPTPTTTFSHHRRCTIFLSSSAAHDFRLRPNQHPRINTSLSPFSSITSLLFLNRRQRGRRASLPSQQANQVHSDGPPQQRERQTRRQVPILGPTSAHGGRNGDEAAKAKTKLGRQARAMRRHFPQLQPIDRPQHDFRSLYGVAETPDKLIGCRFELICFDKLAWNHQMKGDTRQYTRSGVRVAWRIAFREAAFYRWVWCGVHPGSICRFFLKITPARHATAMTCLATVSIAVKDDAAQWLHNCIYFS